MRFFFLLNFICLISCEQCDTFKRKEKSLQTNVKLQKLKSLNAPERKPTKYSGKFLMYYKGIEKKAVQLGSRFGFKFEKKILDCFYLFSDNGGVARSGQEVPYIANLMKEKDKRMLEFEMEEISEQPLEERPETNRVERSADNFTITDPFWPRQWYLKPEHTPSMRIFEAWEMGYSGKGIVVGFISEGIEHTHHDLVDNFNASLSYDYVTDSPGAAAEVDGSGLGTKPAGVVAASKNDQCITGIAYEASIADFRAYDIWIGGFFYTRIASAWTHNLAQTDIFSNGFITGSGSGRGFYPLSKVLKSALLQSITKHCGHIVQRTRVLLSFMTSQWKSLLHGKSNCIIPQEGRDGKGTIQVFTSGTHGHRFDDCNTDGYRNSVYTIGVNSLAHDGRPTWYAEECTNIMTAAYGGDTYLDTQIYLSTTSLNNSCVDDFAGGPASTAVVSGIVALTLQANPELTWRDVQYLIAETSTSDSVPGGNFYKNAAGKNVSNSHGFGLINAEGMVQTAATWKTVPERIWCTSGRLDVNECSGRSVEATFTVDNCHIQYLEHVEVLVSCQATWREYTEIHIVSPQGTDSRILRQRKKDYEMDRFRWTFMSVHTWGENPAGKWTVRMDDFLNCNKNEVCLYYWELMLHGTVTNPLDGKPGNGTLGGYCDDAILCTDDTKCLLGSNICVNCSIVGRIVNNYCLAGNKYCDENTTCSEENTFCNSDNTCEVCADGYHEVDGECKRDGMLGGLCDNQGACEEPDVACDAATEICVSCTVTGYRIIDDFCVKDGVYGGYCDVNITCLEPALSCEPGTEICSYCYYVNHSVLDGFCIEDGRLGGFCSNETSCATPGSGCDQESNTCVDCTTNGYRIVSGYCKKDSILGGYCDANVACTVGTGCDFESSLCVDCSATGYRVVPGGSCREDGMIDGYCDTDIPCTTSLAGCVPGFNICTICYTGHTLIDGYCIEDDSPVPHVFVDNNSNAGKIAGIIIAGMLIGVMINSIIFITVLQKAILARTRYVPTDMKDRFLHVLKFRQHLTK